MIDATLFHPRSWLMSTDGSRICDHMSEAPTGAYVTTSDYRHLQNSFALVEKINTGLQAEIERLRAALRLIAETPGDAYDLRQIARSALTTGDRGDG